MGCITNQQEFDYYITPDGESLNLNDYNISFVMSSQGQGMAGITYQTQAGPFQHGSSPLTYLLQPRTISMVITLKSNGRENYWENRAKFLDYFRPNRQTGTGLTCGKLRKILPSGHTRDIDVLIQSGLGMNIDYSGAYTENRVSEGVQFIAFDPTFYDPTQVSVSASISGFDNLLFPITFPITFGASVIYDTFNVTYAGNWSASPIIVATGPFQSFRIENLTTGELLGVDYAISLGETLTIDTRTGYKTVTNQLGTNLIGTLTTDSDLSTFHIAPNPEAPLGVNNLRLSGSGGRVGQTSLTINYYSRYIGI